MSKRVCIRLVAVPYVYSFLVALFHTIITFRLTYCGPNVINHFYCDDLPLLALSCSDTHMKEILIFAFAGFDMICSSSIVLTSYLFIIDTILRIHSTQGWHKAFSTCDSHMVAITIFFMAHWSLCTYSPSQTTPWTQTKWHLCFTQWWSPCWTHLSIV